jgi:lysozyme family protein
MLRKGDNGEEVKLIQFVLKIDVSRGGHGIFGPGTEAAVKSFQQSKALVADGVVGEKTWGALAFYIPTQLFNFFKKKIDTSIHSLLKKPSIKIKKINRSHFACHCCGKNMIKKELIELCEIIQNKVGTPLTINSGYRCIAHNKKVKGKTGSLHLTGSAADLSCNNLLKLARVCDSLWKQKIIGGIGVYNSFRHVDIGRHRRW